MNFLDMRTILIGHIVTDILCTVVLAFLWLQNRKRYAGTSYWLIDFAFQTTAMILIILRGILPDWISFIVSNTLAVVGAILAYMGLALFVGKKISQTHNYILVVVLVVVLTYFSFVIPNLAARNFSISLALLIVCFQCMWLLLHRVELGMRRITLGVGFIFGIFCLVSLTRIAVILVSPHPSNDYFKSGLYDATLMMAYQILLISLAFGLMMMVNQRYNRDILTQEEKFSKAFRSSPYAITLTRLSDGKLIDVNDGFLAITGYSFAETVGKTTIDLQFWANDADRAAVVKELSKGKRLTESEFQFRKKSGEMMTGLFSAEIMLIDDQPWVLSSISDISVRKATEEKIRLLNLELEKLALTDYMTNLYNQRYFMQRGTEEFKRAQRNNQPMALMMLDVDEFKKINDTFGHEAGDLALQQVARIMKSCLREIDLIGRLGGDEFSVLLSDTSLEDATALAERVRQTIADSSFQTTDQVLSKLITVSVGVAAISDAMSNIDGLRRNADAAMYRAKHSGRNCVVVYQGNPDMVTPSRG